MSDLLHSAKSCPICQHELETRPVSPCMECGGDPRELRHLNDGTHSYGKVLLFGKFPIILCDFCQIDFGTYPSYFFGLSRRRHLGFNDISFIEEVKAEMNEDLYCPSCGYRLAFLNFVKEIRTQSQSDDSQESIA